MNIYQTINLIWKKKIYYFHLDLSIVLQLMRKKLLLKNYFWLFISILKKIIQ